MRRALPCGAVAEEGDDSLALAAELGRERCPGGMRQPGADDPVAAEDLEREVGDVHRAAEPLAVARPLAEHLGHHPAEIGAGRNEVAVRAVVADEVVGVPHHACRADGDRLLADAAVRRPEDHALLEELGGAVLEAADQHHLPVLLEKRRTAGRPLARLRSTSTRRPLVELHDVAVGIERVETLAAARSHRRSSRRGRPSGTRTPCPRSSSWSASMPVTKRQKWPVPEWEGGEAPEAGSQPRYSSSSTSKLLPGTRSMAMSRPVASGTPTIRLTSASS